MATTVDPQIDAAVADLKAKEQALVDANAANTQAQAAAKSAVATASGTAASAQSAQNDLSASVDALVTLVETLKAGSPTPPAGG